MKKFYISNIKIFDVNQKLAFSCDFINGINVITGTENHVGKSSLIKSIYYAFGAEVKYDNVWNLKAKLVSVTFFINNVQYTINRLNKRFLIQDVNQNKIFRTESISDELAKYLAKLFGFKIILSNKLKKRIIAPPVYYFLPYYIDQDSGWGNEVYTSFKNLMQFDKKERLKCLYYHLGYYNEEIDELLNKISILKNENDVLDDKIKKIDTTLDIIEKQSLDFKYNLDEEMDEKIAFFKNNINSKLEEFDNIKNKLSEITNIISILNHNLKNLKKTNLNSEKNLYTKCPNCFYEWFNNGYKDIAYYEYSKIKKEQSIEEHKKTIQQHKNLLKEYKEKYKNLYNEITSYTLLSSDNEILSKFMISKGFSNFKEKLNNNKKSLDLKIKENNKILNKENKELNSKISISNIDKIYNEKIIFFLKKLNALDERAKINAKICSPMGGQGNLTVKNILSSYLAIFKMMEESENQVIRFTFIVDSPRSKEASDKSSIDIMSEITNISNINQVIFATVNYDLYSKKMEKDVNKIELSRIKELLNKEDFNKLNKTNLIDYMTDKNNWEK